MDERQGIPRQGIYQVPYEPSLFKKLHETYIRKFPNEISLRSVAEMNKVEWESRFSHWNNRDPVAGIMYATVAGGRMALLFPKVAWEKEREIYVAKPRFQVNAQSENEVDVTEVTTLAERIAGSLESALSDYDPRLHRMTAFAETRPEQPEKKFRIPPVYCLGSNRY